MKVKMTFIGKKNLMRESKRIGRVDLIKWVARASCMPRCSSSLVESAKDITV